MGTRQTKDEEEVDTVPPPRAVPPGPAFHGGATRLLSRADIEFLSDQAGYPRPNHWGALYLSHRDGKSFSCLLYGHRKPHFAPGIVGKARVVLVVRDQQGALFGGYSGCVWKDPDTIHREAERERRVRNRPGATSPPPATGAQPDQGFHGEGECHVFTLRPERDVYHPSGRNANYKVLQTTWPEEDYNGMWCAPGHQTPCLLPGLAIGNIALKPSTT
eukprot:Hpha_TRINITY_DN15680_c3_g8::TRINITY_DN15680_c3_g8_i5::g.99974::m.99974